MSTNTKQYSEGGITRAMAVGAGVSRGDIIAIGGEGLIGHVETDRATTATIDAGTAAPGLADGEASVYLPQINRVVEVPNSGGVSAVGEAAYVTSGGAYTSTPTANDGIGYFLTTGADGANVLVGLASLAVVP